MKCCAAWRRDASWAVGNVDVDNRAWVIFRGAQLNVSLWSLRGNLLKRRHQCQQVLRPFKKLGGDASTCCSLPIGSGKAPTARCLLSQIFILFFHVSFLKNVLIELPLYMYFFFPCLPAIIESRLSDAGGASALSEAIADIFRHKVVFS